MKKLEFVQDLPISLEEAWAFFSSPKNLNEITPPEMNFRILDELSEKMYPGMFIRYRIVPFLGIPMYWVTELTHIREGEFFVDEQRSGPYKIWHHEHHFTPIPGGVRMTDKLYYDIGMGPLGWLAGQLFVHKQVRSIFDYRYTKLQQLFPASKEK